MIKDHVGLSDRVATCGLQIYSRRRRKTLLISLHLGVYHREVHHKKGSRFAFLSLCVAWILASTRRLYRHFPSREGQIPQETSEPLAGSRSMVLFAAPANNSLSSKVMNAETIITKCISQNNMPSLASTSSCSLTCDGKTFVGKKGGSSIGMSDFCEVRRLDYA